MVLTKPEYIAAFVEYWVDHLSDISEFPDIAPESLHFWKKISKTDKRKKPHRVLKGACAKWMNDSIDFAVKHNKWAVM